MRNILLGVFIGFTAQAAWAQQGFVQEGKASFYADRFEGRITASGERYSHSLSTCAHLSLPFGTQVRVTNLSNNLSVVCRVNDRGPFVPNRIIDLSQSAARQLGFIEAGLADVRIEVVSPPGNAPGAAQAPSAPPAPQRPKPAPASPTPPPAPRAAPPSPTPPQGSAPAEISTEHEIYALHVKRVKPGGFTVQIGSYRELVNLLRIADDLRESLGSELRVQVAMVNGERIYRLQVGHFGTRPQAEAFRKRVAQHYPSSFVVEIK